MVCILADAVGALLQVWGCRRSQTCESKEVEKNTGAQADAVGA